MDGGLIPGDPSPRFARFFAGYCRRMMRRDFAGVRVAHGSGDVIGALESHTGPAIALLNHASWWDPLVGLVIADRFMPTRTLASPIESAQLEKFRFMRRIGLFGIDPESRDALRVLVSHALELFGREPRTLLGLTPQGRFTDAREPVRLRPGAAAVASRLGRGEHADGATSVRVVSIACEYVFWNDRRPELLIRAEPCPEPERATTAGWTRAMTASMQRNADALAALAIARDAGAFEPMLGGSSGINPLYDLLLRLRGRRPEIEARRATGAERTTA